ncbi:MAG: rubrerythrin family protein, partial [Chitinivibrionia bacterium]|nr:rubrerythrin family protein [Chitinivibrionia bacterium]
MLEMTRVNLEAAFAGESQAHMKYSLFAEKAEREGFAEVARLFR